MDYELRLTDDGSITLYSTKAGDTYHSMFGAIQESQFIFIDNGLLYKSLSSKVNILEVGFGTGLNALLSFKATVEKQLQVDYTAIEPFPIDIKIIDQLKYKDHFVDEDLKKAFSLFHSKRPGNPVEISNSFIFEFIHDCIQEVSLKQDYYDLVYFDAFGPDAQAEMWTVEIFNKIYSSMKQGALLLTFSAKGLVKRNLRLAGFVVDRIGGPPGKRHILRAFKK